MEKLRVGMLYDAFLNAFRTDSAAQVDRIKSYPVVAVLNPGDGPDEQILEVKGMTWDHRLGVLRLEIAE